MQELRIVHRNALDIEKWDSIINSDASSSLYQTIWYQDLITDGDWYAVVRGDYEAMMSFVIHKRGFGRLLAIDTVVNPLLSQKSIILPNSKTYHSEDFIDFLKRNYRQINLKISSQNSSTIGAKTLHNHIVHLGSDADILAKNYNRNTRRNIKSALVSGISVEYTKDVDETMKLLINNDVTGLVGINRTRLGNLISNSIQNEQGYILRAIAQNETCAVGFFINYKKSVYFLLCASSDIGIKLKAMYAIIDHSIKISLGSYEVFDFTGSSIDDIARRNLGFGAEVEIYDLISYTKWF